MKTREKILLVALELFNAEGVGGQSAVDIASALGISAGHLYYHFKGKAEIVAELMARHREEIDLVVAALEDAARSREASLETLWTHLHILVEETWDARFFYREPALASGDPAIAAQARRIFAGLRSGIGAMLQALAEGGALEASPETLDGLARQMVTGVAFHVHVLALENPDEPPRERIARAAAQIMVPAAGLAA